MRWEPLLDGALADEARAAVREVAAAVAAEPAAAAAVDRTVFWAYACHALDEPFAHEAYDASLEDLARELERGAASPALHGGLAGLGWTLCHVMDGGAQEPLAAIDAALLGALAREPWPGSHDLTHGLVGIGVYFLERLGPERAPRFAAAAPVLEDARAGLARVVHQLAALASPRAEVGGGALAWRTGPELLPAHLRPAWPEGFDDCGAAHGAPGAIALLARAADREDLPPEARSEARRLRDGAVAWLRAQRLDPDPRGRFPSRIRPGEAAADRSRAAWCYGDPGVAAALWRAAPELARETALDVARRDPETAGVRDAGLCHGAAGLAHLCNRFYQATGDAAFAETARGWCRRTLAMRRAAGAADAAAAFGGFAAWHADAPDAPPAYRPVAGLVEGSIGVALALLAALTPASEPAWDRLLLCDVPPRSA